LGVGEEEKKMTQFQDNSRQQACPLPLASEPAADRDIVPGEEGCVALPPVEAPPSAALPPPTLWDDNCQWMVLL
jgi:hypothetical protein